MTGPGSRNVLLRPIAEDDWPAVHAWASQERVCRYQAWGPNTVEQTRNFVQDAAHAWTSIPRTRLVYTITLHGSVVGNCDLNLRGQGHGEISYVLQPRLLGKGTGHCRCTPGRPARARGAQSAPHLRHRDPRNIASAVVLQRLGMHYEGRMRETMLIRDGWRDSDLYSLLVPEWHDQASPARPDNAPSESGNAWSAPA
jgi:[ribosomal protein S5]-alanine N-acetyltransferase